MRTASPSRRATAPHEPAGAGRHHGRQRRVRHQAARCCLGVAPAGAEVDEVSLLAFDSVTGSYGPPLLVQLSEAIAASSVTGAVTVRDGSGAACPTLVWFDVASNRVVILLRERWQPTAYTVTVTAAVADLAGNHLAAPYAWSFTARPPGSIRERLWSVP